MIILQKTFEVDDTIINSGLRRVNFGTTGRSSTSSCYAEHKIVGSGGARWSRATAFLEQPSPLKFGILLKGSFGIFLKGSSPSCWFMLLNFASCRPLPHPRRPWPPPAVLSVVSYIQRPCFFKTYTMNFQPTGLSVPAFTQWLLPKTRVPRVYRTPAAHQRRAAARHANRAA
jgi:hypothetical protein